MFRTVLLSCLASRFLRAELLILSAAEMEKALAVIFFCLYNCRSSMLAALFLVKLSVISWCWSGGVSANIFSSMVAASFLLVTA